jgi:streptogramin lyase
MRFSKHGGWWRSHRHSRINIAMFVLVLAWPFVTGRAQDRSQTPAPQGQDRGGQGGGAGRGGPGGRGGGNTDYNLSKRSEADVALSNPYARNEAWFKMPPSRPLGSANGIGIDKDGKSVWIIERCGGQDVCIGSHVAPIIKFDANGNFVKAFGADMITYPHGLYVDTDGNVWVTDLQSNVNRPQRGGGAGGRAAAPGVAPAAPAAPAAPVVPNGAQVLKFSPDGKLLLRIGVPGVYGNDETHLSQPSAVVTAPNGDIFVADGHDSAPANSRIVRYDKTGKFIKAWSTCGNGTGTATIDCQHAIAIDSQGRIFVGDRGNARVSIYDQDGNFIAEWKQFGKPSGVFIDKNDILYVADSESSVRDFNAYLRGVHVGSAKTGEVTAFLPDPRGNPTPWNPLRFTSGAEGVAADKDGVIYIAQVTPPGLARYTRK